MRKSLTALAALAAAGSLAFGAASASAVPLVVPGPYGPANLNVCLETDNGSACRTRVVETDVDQSGSLWELTLTGTVGWFSQLGIVQIGPPQEAAV